MAESDEYYGSDKARETYNNLYEAYSKTGMGEKEIGEKLKLLIPEDKYFNDRGFTNYHGGGNITFEENEVREWLLSKNRS